MTSTFPLQRIVSGGQTGVDRAALDVALELGIPCGGWCPAGRRAEDGAIPDRYPLQCTEEWRYDVRTEANIRDTDGTLIIAASPLTGGTKLTRDLARRMDKPLLILPAKTLFAAEMIEPWLKDHKISLLNVAGPRESTCPGIYRQTVQLLLQWLTPRSDQVR
ncbi:putative molybdenum carrier protein [Rubinisphaera margarita]|uniref:putative molybdenum carrier protein n=1 Tax=Rubinisphaera margarita TaxID=2909586 RepID=UPI001EE8844B|nr:putative molybdenum carrier protein [Rubinisphaera margarita]MCG6154539.1 putative molybdenum carrier protein [Rubinisphaera margarita]